MWKHNDGKDEPDIVQNQFTAYLVTAVKRHKIAYLMARQRRENNEISSEQIGIQVELFTEADFNDSLPLLEQIENPILLALLMQAKERERYIFLRRILDERSFSDLSNELGITYKAVTHSYYRFLDRMRRALTGGEDEK